MAWKGKLQVTNVAWWQYLVNAILFGAIGTGTVWLMGLSLAALGPAFVVAAVVGLWVTYAAYKLFHGVFAWFFPGGSLPKHSRFSLGLVAGLTAIATATAVILCAPLVTTAILVGIGYGVLVGASVLLSALAASITAWVGAEPASAEGMVLLNTMNSLEKVEAAKGDEKLRVEFAVVASNHDTASSSGESGEYQDPDPSLT